MGFIPPLIAAVSAAAGTAAAGAGVGVAAGTAAAGTAAAVGTAAGTTAAVAGGTAATLGTVSTLAGSGATLATALRGLPKPPNPGAPPSVPTFASGLVGGGNSSLAAQSPFAALGGTNRGVFGSFGSNSGGKALLGQ